MQDKLLRKLGNNAYPFLFQFPANSPSSVTLQPGDDDQGKPLGVEYTVKIYVAEGDDDRVRVMFFMRKFIFPKCILSEFSGDFSGNFFLRFTTDFRSISYATL